MCVYVEMQVPSEFWGTKAWLLLLLNEEQVVLATAHTSN